MLDVIEHVMDETYTLSEVRRVLKPGGFLILITPFRNILGNWMDADNLFFLPLIRLKNVLLGKKIYTPKHRHYTTDDILHFCGPGWMVEVEHITGGPPGVIFSFLGKSLSLVEGKLMKKRVGVPLISRLQNKISVLGQNSLYRNWGVFANKLHLVLTKKS